MSNPHDGDSFITPLERLVEQKAISARMEKIKSKYSKRWKEHNPTDTTGSQRPALEKAQKAWNCRRGAVEEAIGALESLSATGQPLRRAELIRLEFAFKNCLKMANAFSPEELEATRLVPDTPEGLRLLTLQARLEAAEESALASKDGTPDEVEREFLRRQNDGDEVEDEFLKQQSASSSPSWEQPSASPSTTTAHRATTRTATVAYSSCRIDELEAELNKKGAREKELLQAIADLDHVVEAIQALQRKAAR